MSTPVAGALAVTPLYATPADAIVSWDDAGATWRSLAYLATPATITLTGDVTGSGTTAIATTVVRLQGRPLAATAPGTNQVIQWSGTQWQPATLAGGGTVTSITAGAGITVSPSPIVGAGTVSLVVPVAVANGGTGTTSVFTAGSVMFAGPGGVHAQDNANLFWDDAANRLGIGTTNPVTPLDVLGTGGAPAVSGTASTAMLRVENTSGGNALDIGNYATTPYGAWLQGIDRGNLAFTYPLVLQPNGGNVGIGTASPRGTLEVNYALAAPNSLVTAVSSGAILGGSSIGLQVSSWDFTGSGGYVSSIQSRHLQATGFAYPLLLNSQGGGVVVGSIYTPLPRGVLEVGVGATGPTPIATATPSGGFLISDATTNVGIQAGIWNIGGGAFPFFIQARHFSAASVPYNIVLQPVGGNVGIGTATPGALLEVNGAARINSTLTLPAGVSLNLGSTTTVFDSGGSFYMRSAAIRCESAAAAVYAIFNAAGTYNQTGAWIAVSSRELKQEIAPYTRGLDALVQLQPCVFRYRAGTPFARGEDEPSDVLIGFIADEVEQVLPELVGETVATVGKEAVAVATLTPGNALYCVVNSIKELAARIEALEARP